MTQQRKNPKPRRAKKQRKTIGIASLYEKAWNEVVQALPDWKKKIIINNWPYSDPSDSRIADEVARKAAVVAERRAAALEILKGKDKG